MISVKHSLEKTGYVEVEGGSIHYRVYEPYDSKKLNNVPILFIHGGPGGSHALMYDCLGDLADDRVAVFYDQLGSYFSPAAPTKDLMRLDRFSDEVDRLIQTLNLERVVLLGHSWGAAIAVNFALKNSSYLDGLILSCPLLSTQLWLQDCRRLLATLPADIQQIILQAEATNQMESEAYKKAKRVYLSRHFLRSEKTPAALVKHRQKSNSQIRFAMWGAKEFDCTGLLQDLDLFPRLSEINIPTLLMSGEYDFAMPETMKKAQALIKNSCFSIIPNAGHLAYVDNNSYYLTAIREFLEILSHSEMSS